MNGNYLERPKHFTIGSNDCQWQQPKTVQNECGETRRCWPVACEAQMWEEAYCRNCSRITHWIGIGAFDDGQQYLLEDDAWCFWCLPREKFSEEELVAVQLAEWARQQTKDEIVEFVRSRAIRSDGETESVWELSDDIRRCI